MEPEPTNQLDADRIAHRLETIDRGLSAMGDRGSSDAELIVLGSLVGAIAHEFASLLTPLRAQAQLAARRPDDARQAQRLADRVLTTADRGVSLVDAILALTPQALTPQTLAPHALADPVPPSAAACCSPHRADGMDASGSGTDVEAVVAGAVESLADGPGVLVHIDGPLHVAMNETGLERIMLNLLDNARRAVRDGGAITIFGSRDTGRLGRENGSSGTDGSYAVIRVEDTGTGMDAETAASVFEPFVSGPDGGRRGIGLALVQGLVHHHGGSVWCESTPGEGSVFTIRLPLADPTARSSAA